MNARRLGLTKDIDVGICGDSALAAQALTARLASKAEVRCRSSADARAAKARAAREEWERELTKMAEERQGRDDGSRMTPRTALAELEKAMPEVIVLREMPCSTCNIMFPTSSRTPWCLPTLATFARSPTATSVSIPRAGSPPSSQP